jgi:hypothetical protein
MDFETFVAYSTTLGLLDAMKLFIILLIIIFFFSWAILNLTKLRNLIKITVSIGMGVMGSVALMIVHFLSSYGFFITESILSTLRTGAFLSPFFYAISFLIALFPLLILIKNKKYFSLSLLVFFIAMRLVDFRSMVIFPFSFGEPKFLLLLLFFSIILLLHDKREDIIGWDKLNRLSLIVSLMGLVLLILPFLVENVSYFIGGLITIWVFYIMISLWVILWSSLTFVLFRKPELIE